MPPRKQHLLDITGLTHTLTPRPRQHAQDLYRFKPDGSLSLDRSPWIYQPHYRVGPMPRSVGQCKKTLFFGGVSLLFILISIFVSFLLFCFVFVCFKEREKQEVV